MFWMCPGNSLRRAARFSRNGGQWYGIPAPWPYWNRNWRRQLPGIRAALKDLSRFQALIRVRDFLLCSLLDVELFARSYARFALSRSTDNAAGAALAQELARIHAQRAYLPTQWETVDFAPVAEVLARLLIKKGLLR